MEHNINNRSTGRRSVLKSVGGIASASLVSSGFADASAGISGGRYVGVSYDTQTHQEQSHAFGQLAVKERTIQGQLNVGGFTQPLGQSEYLEPIGNDNQFPVYKVVYREGQYIRDGLPLIAKFTVYSHAVCGHLTRPNHEFGALGYTLASERLGITPEQVKGGLVGKGHGDPTMPKKDIPSQGIPKQLQPVEPVEVSE